MATRARSAVPVVRAHLTPVTLWRVSGSSDAREQSGSWRSRGSTQLTSPKLEQAVRNPPNFHWAGPAGQQPPIWTDVLAEMSRHIYIRNKIGEGIQAPIFQVTTFKFVTVIRQLFMIKNPNILWYLVVIVCIHFSKYSLVAYSSTEEEVEPVDQCLISSLQWGVLLCCFNCLDGVSMVANLKYTQGYLDFY